MRCYRHSHKEMESISVLFCIWADLVLCFSQYNVVEGVACQF